MKSLIGRKIGMSQIFSETGTVVPVTVIEAGPCVVTRVRNQEKDGYEALQIGFGERKGINKAQKGQLGKLEKQPAIMREVTVDEAANVGDILDVSIFSDTKLVNVSGVSKGKGFAGTIKRHNFHRGPKSHGSDSYRAPGSIGSMYPQKIWKGKKMAGRMGGSKSTALKLSVEKVDPEHNLLLVRGAVPGPRGGYLLIRSAA